MVEHIAQRVIAESKLLLKRCFAARETASPIIKSKIELNPMGVAAKPSIKIPTTNPVSVAVISEENIQQQTKSANGSIGFA